MTTRSRTLATVLVTSLLALAACGSDSGESSPTSANTSPDTAAAADTTELATSTEPSIAPTASGSFPVTVASCGNEVTIDRAPSAVVVGWPTIITTLDALGVGDSVIGYTSADFATVPPTDAEAIAPDFRTSREVMIATGLDMFIVNDENQIDGSEGNLGWSDLDTLEAGAYVLGGYCLDDPAPTDIDVVYDDINALGAVFGVADRAIELNEQLSDQVAAAAAGLDDLAGSRAAVVQAFEGTLYALSGSYYAMIPAALGFDSVFSDLDANFAEISAEEVLTLAPDVVIIVHEGDTSAASAAVDEVSELLASAPAISEGRIATVENGELSGGGVSVVDAIVDVGEQLQAAANG